MFIVRYLFVFSHLKTIFSATYFLAHPPPPPYNLTSQSSFKWNRLGAGMPEDVMLVWNELEEARDMVDQLDHMIKDSEHHKKKVNISHQETNKQANNRNSKQQQLHQQPPVKVSG